MFRSIYLLALLGLTSMSVAYPSEPAGQNYEVYTNDLGYESVQFKPGMEPGSSSYIRRFGRSAGLTTSSAAGALAKSEEKRTTTPSAGRSRIPYGCETDIANTILATLADVCDETTCDTGTPVAVPVKVSDSGVEKDAEVTFVARGNYPTGMKDLLTKALQAEVPLEAVEIEEVTTTSPMISPYV